MIILELFLSPHCVSAPSAIAVAEDAVRQVPGVKLVVRSDKEARARLLGLFIYPVFVLEGEVLAVGEPRLEQLIQTLKYTIEQKRKTIKQGGLS